MPRKCAIYKCRSNYRNQPYKRVFRIPRDSVDRSAWLACIPNPSRIRENSGICEDHWPENYRKIVLYGKLRPADPPCVFTDYQLNAAELDAENNKCNILNLTLSSNTSSVIRCANKKTVSKIITPVDYQADEIDSNANLKQTTNNETSELPDEESSPDSTANEVTEPKVDENEKKFCQKIDSLDASQVHELLDAYMEYCQDAPTFDCSTCGVEFPTKALLDQHFCNPAAAAELTAKGSKSERKCCRICGRRFNKLASLHKHLLTHETVQRESEHTCAVCDLPFATALQLKNHMSTVHPLARPYKCTLCTKTFQTPATLRNHFETHSTEKPWQCSLCHKSFPKKYYLMTHVKSMHQRVRKYECSLCKQGLRHLGEYKAHMLRHAGTKPFQCDQCDKCYYQKGGLLTHMLTHSGETPFTCWVCLKGFRRKADCMRHVERSHSPTSANKMRMEDASASVEQEEATDFTISEEIKMEPVEEVETVDEKPQSDFDSLLEHLASEIGD